MKPLYVINDLHLSTIRTGGTTQVSAYNLRQHLLQGFEKLLSLCDSDVLINGDFADDYKMQQADMLAAYWIIRKWLEKGHSLYALPGNHCLSKDSTNLSSFEFLFRMLEAQYPEQIILKMEPSVLRDGMYAIPHVLNQEVLDTEIANLPVSTYVFLHANYENPFAIHSDHSLNISEAQAKNMQADHLIFGHVHQAAKYLRGKVILVGNQVSSSVSDCLGNDEKFMLRISDEGIEHIPVWSAAGSFAEQDWQDLTDGPQFVRVTGKATSAQAADVVAAIARFRATSDAFVITNAVQIEGLDDEQMTLQSLEEIKAFSVMGALLEILTPEEGAKIQKLMGTENV